MKQFTVDIRSKNDSRVPSRSKVSPRDAGRYAYRPRQSLRFPVEQGEV